MKRTTRCGSPAVQLHQRTLRFVMSQAVGKAPDYAPPQGDLSIQDSKSALTIRAELSAEQTEGRAVYGVSLLGEARNAGMRLRMVLAGFSRYGEMEQVGETGVAFVVRNAPRRAMMRVLLPYSRNISSVETMMAAEALRGQMTTGTLGFSQT